MESLIADFVQCTFAIAKFLFSEKKLSTTLCLRLVLKFSKNLLISENPKCCFIRQTREATRTFNFW